jgi:UPF0755 protein
MGYKQSVVTVLLLVFFTLFFYSFSVFIPYKLKDAVELEIKEGMSFSGTLNILKQKGLIRDKNIILLLGIILGYDREIKRGVYLFHGSLSPYSVMLHIVKGHVVENTVTIPEGFDIWQIARRLEEAEIVKEDEFLSLARKGSFLDRLRVDAPSVEGYIFPDTYRFPKRMSPEAVLKKMVETMREHFTEDMVARRIKLGMSEKEVLTLASIIEKEARVDDERPLISAVFHNRLRRGMPLQADPTSVYGFKDISSGITSQDLQRETPYNTYQIRGLPIGPIASPGLKSIRASLYPADVQYLYFVSRNNGRHYFSSTEAEHRRAIKRFRVVMRGRK